MIRIGIVGYGNLAKGVECAIRQNPDMTLTAVFTRRDPASVSIQTPDVPVCKLDEVLQWKDNIDVMILCGGSATDLGVQTPHYAKYFHVVDSFDTHAKINQHFAAVDPRAKEGGKVVRSRFNIPIMFRVNKDKLSEPAQPQKPQSPQPLTQKAVQDWFGTQPALMAHLMKNTRYPKECQEQGFQGKVVVSVNVDQDGAMSVKGGEYMPWSDKKDASVVVNTYKNADGTQAAKLSDEELQALLVKEAERVLKLAPKLKPYKNEKGETVSAAFKVPVMFRLN